VNKNFFGMHIIWFLHVACPDVSISAINKRRWCCISTKIIVRLGFYDLLLTSNEVHFVNIRTLGVNLAKIKKFKPRMYHITSSPTIPTIKKMDNRRYICLIKNKNNENGSHTTSTTYKTTQGEITTEPSNNSHHDQTSRRHNSKTVK
jgi:hypothetical protein